MNPQAKIDFLNELEQDGIVFVKEKIFKEYYNDEYKALAEAWVKEKESLSFREFKLNRWHLVIAVIGILVSILSIILID